MSERIDQFCEDLRVKLTAIDENMQALKTEIDRRSKTADEEVRTRLDVVKKRMEQDRAKVIAAQNDLKKWVAERKADTREKISEWKAKGEKAILRSRAESAERYAAAAAVLAAAAVDEAQQAALEAWLARKDAEGAQATQGA
jgi:hypothetical protein